MISSFSKNTAMNGINTQLNSKINTSEKGQPLGVCPLSANGLIDPSFYDPSVCELKGTWDALINNPTLADGVGNRGDMYIVSVGGSQFTPNVDFLGGDFVIYDGAKWKGIHPNTNVYTRGEIDSFISTLNSTDTSLQSQITTNTNNITTNTNNITTANTNITNVQTNLTTHINNTTGAHNATSITCNPGGYGMINGTNVSTQLGNIDATLYSQSQAIGQLDLSVLRKNQNLADLNSIPTARTNLNVYSKTETDSLITTLNSTDTSLQSQITTNTNNVSTLTTTKIDNATNQGLGEGTIFKDKTTTNLNFKSIKAGTGLTIANNTNDITINANAFPSSSVATSQNLNYITISNVQNNLSQLDTQTKTNTDNFSNHVAGVSFKHTANDITTNTAGFVISANDVQLNLGQLDAGILVNTNNFTNHINSATAHPANFITTSQNLNYITASQVQNNLSQLDIRAFVNAGNFTNHVNGSLNRHTATHINNDATSRTYLTQANLDLVNDDIDTRLVDLTTNKIDTITSGDTQTLAISGTGTSRTLTNQVNTNNGLLKFNSTGTITSNGAIPIGNGTNFTTNTITGTTNQINITNGAGTITLSAPQNIDTLANVNFGTFTLSGITSTLNNANAILQMTGSDATFQMTGLNSSLQVGGNNSLISGGGIHRNTLDKCHLQCIQATGLVAPTTSFNSFGSLLLNYNTIDGWDRCNAIFLPEKRTILKAIAPQISYFAIQLVGTGWATVGANNGLEGILLGFTTEDHMSFIQNGMNTNQRLGFDGVWQTANNRIERAIYGHFETNRSLWNYGSINNVGTRTPAGTGTDPNTDDVIICYLDTSLNFTLEWRDSSASYAVKATGKIAHPDGITSFLSNFNQSGIVPIFSTYYKGAIHGIKILSQRECASLNISIINGENLFY